MNVLLVDNDPKIVRELSALLVERGHQVSVASDGIEALNILAAGNFPVVMTGCVIPRLDGTELIMRIRARSDRPSTHVIVLCAVGEEDIAERALALGADDLLSKPVRQADLVARLSLAERMLGLQSQVIAHSLQIEGVNQRIKRDLDAAGRVQRALLPARQPMIPGWNVAWRSLASHELAGDTLNVFQLDEHHLAGYVLDVSGHGVSAALLAVQVSRLLSPLLSAGSMLKKVAPPPKRYRLVPPMDLMSNLAIKFPFTIESPQFFTIVYVMIDVRTGDTIVASAGHPGPIIMPANGDCVSHDMASNAIGMLAHEQCEFAELRLRLQPGDRLVLYSDGVSEARNPAGEVFDAPHIVRSIQDSRNLDLDQTLDALINSVKIFSGGSELSDDISLLAIQRPL